MASAMDQPTARHLFDEGAIFVFLDVPVGTEFGIDYNSWQVGAKFKGVKMIPPGIHFIYYSAVNSSNQTAPRTGFFYNFKQREICVRKWNKQMEDISEDVVSKEEQERIEANKKELDKFLGAYPYESYKQWVSLTNHLTPELMKQLEPTNGRISSVCELVSEPSNSQSRKEAQRRNPTPITDNDEPLDLKQAESLLPNMETVPGSTCNFTNIPKQKYPEGAGPAEITKYNLDHSFVLDNLLKTYYKDNELGILGELQFSFVCFLIGQVYDGFEQWKKLVTLLCSCEEAPAKHSELYTSFINLLHYHIKEIPSDFFIDIVSSDNFLTLTLQSFFANVESSDASNELKMKSERFKKHLEKKFEWDFTSEPDEYAPVIVT